jgi:hypothetical protein
MNFDWFQALLQHRQRNRNASEILETKFSSIGHCCSPLCAACQLGKGKHQSTNAKCVINVQAMKLKRGYDPTRRLFAPRPVQVNHWEERSQV